MTTRSENLTINKLSKAEDIVRRELRLINTQMYDSQTSSVETERAEILEGTLETIMEEARSL